MQGEILHVLGDAGEEDVVALVNTVLPRGSLAGVRNVIDSVMELREQRFLNLCWSSSRPMFPLSDDEVRRSVLLLKNLSWDAEEAIWMAS